jgi:hypothetical protein
MQDLDKDEQQFLVTLLTQSLFLKPVNPPSGEEGRVVTSAGVPVAHGQTARGLHGKGLVGWPPSTRPFGEREEPVPISFTETGKTEAERLRSAGVSPLLPGLSAPNSGQPARS